MTPDFDLWALFVSALISSTLLPGGSEVVLALLDRNGERDTVQIVLVATAGNTLGGLITFGMGWLISWRYPADELARPAQQMGVVRVRRWGAPVLLLSWLPIIGDPLCLAAGWLRVSPLLAALMIGGGKLLRYIAVVWLL
jgi:membrane protein YqaA with SNARE-associated domain